MSEEQKSHLLVEEISDHKIIIYQMMPRLFGNKKSLNKEWGTLEENGVGKFNDIDTTALTEIKKLGVTHIWFTGIIEHATLTDYSKFGIATDDPDVVKGRAGSPYAIKDYYDVDPDLAVDVKKRMAEFENLVTRTHSKGLKVIIDFVPNHVARAYKSDAKPAGIKDLGEEDDKNVSFSPKNNFYYLPGKSFVPPSIQNNIKFGSKSQDHAFKEFPAKATGNDVFSETPSESDWYETVKLNYGVDIQNNKAKHFDTIPDTWEKMKDILIFWTNKKVDGFRCDMAEMVPVEFWEWAIPQVQKVNPEIFFIAEIYNPNEYRNYIHKGRFNYLYDKVTLYDTLKAVIQGKTGANSLTDCWQELNGINSHMLRFLENHDEQRIASGDFASHAIKGIPMMIVTSTLNSGPVLIYSGQEVGEPGSGKEGFSGDDGRTTIFDYWGIPEHQKWMNEGKFDGDGLSIEQKKLRDFYAKLLTACTQNEAIKHGKLIDLQQLNFNKENYDPTKIYSYIRYTKSQKLLIVVNFDTEAIEAKVTVPYGLWSEVGITENKKYTITDLLYGQKLSFKAREGVKVKLEPLSGYIFEIK